MLIKPGQKKLSRVVEHLICLLLTIPYPRGQGISTKPGKDDTVKRSDSGAREHGGHG